MGKSAILKDAFNRPVGYVRLIRGEAVCRVTTGSAAQIMLVFEEGQQQIHKLDDNAFEQRFPCQGSDLSGCCVFNDNELLLVTDESMRLAFEKHLCTCTQRVIEKREKKTDAGDKLSVQTVEKRDDGACAQPLFSQRRWPPPPCMCQAVYRQGMWKEE